MRQLTAIKVPFGGGGRRGRERERTLLYLSPFPEEERKRERSLAPSLFPWSLPPSSRASTTSHSHVRVAGLFPSPSHRRAGKPLCPWSTVLPLPFVLRSPAVLFSSSSSSALCSSSTSILYLHLQHRLPALPPPPSSCFRSFSKTRGFPEGLFGISTAAAARGVGVFARPPSRRLTNDLAVAFRAFSYISARFPPRGKFEFGICVYG